MNLRDKSEELYMDTVKEVQLAIKSTASYPSDHPTSRQIVGKSYETLANLLHKQAALTVSTFGNKLLVDNVPIDGKNTLFANFAKDLDQRRIDSIIFYRGLSKKDFTIFLNAMKKP